MDAIKYVKTLERMMNDNSITIETWEEFNEYTPEEKVRLVEDWGKNNVTQEEINKQQDRLIDMINVMVQQLWVEFHELAERIELIEDKIQGILSDD
jgi:hypothetical protein